MNTLNGESGGNGNFRWGTPYSRSGCDHVWSPWAPKRPGPGIVRWCLFCATSDWADQLPRGEVML